MAKYISPSAFVLSFLGQITSKDFAQGAPQAQTFANADTMGKVKFLTNDVVGRITGINPFGESTQFKQTINPAGMFNKYVGLGLLFNSVYPLLPRVPQKGLARKAGGALIAGGILGGLFDDPTPEAFGRNTNVKNAMTPQGTGGTMP